MNARGYFELHSHVVQVIERALREKMSPGDLLKKDLPEWYRIRLSG